LPPLLTGAFLRRLRRRALSCKAIGLPSGGAIRVSLGLASNLADVHRFEDFADEFADLAAVPDDLPPRTGC
jgi:hypothetical protein